MEVPSDFTLSGSQLGIVGCCLGGILGGDNLGMEWESPSLGFSDPNPQPNQDTTPALGVGCWPTLVVCSGLPVPSCALESTRCCGLNVSDGT